MNTEIGRKVKAIIVDNLGVDENEVISSASFTDDLGADSLDTVELVMEFEKEFEKEFDIQIPDEEAEKITTVRQAIEAIRMMKVGTYSYTSSYEKSYESFFDDDEISESSSSYESSRGSKIKKIKGNYKK